MTSQSGIPPKTWQPPNVTIETTLVVFSTCKTSYWSIMQLAYFYSFFVYRSTVFVQIYWLLGRSPLLVCDLSCILNNYLVLVCRMGTFECELYWKHAPNTCRNFAELARRGYYNGILFHRIIKDFMIQTGDPTGTGLCVYLFVAYNSSLVNRFKFNLI